MNGIVTRICRRIHEVFYVPIIPPKHKGLLISNSLFMAPLLLSSADKWYFFAFSKKIYWKSLMLENLRYDYNDIMPMYPIIEGVVFIS